MGEAHGPLPRWATPATWLLARAYGAAVSWRNARFERGAGIRVLEVGGVRVPVLSVGNITAGGTGKSPFVSWCAAEMRALGVRPFIALRGYRARDGRSDEAMEHRLELARRADWRGPGDLVQEHGGVAVGPDRLASLRALPELAARPRGAAAILDDGFQHRTLARDLDIVLVDATRPGLGGDLLPNGWLREPARNLSRASMVVLTKADDPARHESAAELVRRFRGRPHDAACVHRWRGVAVHGPQRAHAAPLESGVPTEEPVAWLCGRRVVVACALGNPAHFIAMVEEAGAQVAGRLVRKDHAPFSADELEQCARRSGADAVVLTRKDLVKLDRLPRVAMAVPELAIAFIDGEPRVRAAIGAAVSAATRSATGS